MWPQKWKASASPGFTSAPTAPAPAASVSSRETRARKPRREVDAASSSTSAVGSGMCLGDPALRRGEDALQLAPGVERALGVNRAVPVERDREGAAGDPPVA